MKRHAFVWATIFVLWQVTTSSSEEARQILDAAGVKGGLIVHVGCGDGTLTAAMGAEPGALVQGLDRNPANVTAARRALAASGLYGRVSIGLLRDNRLPYVDNLVNLLIWEGRGAGIAAEEIARVLAPRGAVLVRGTRDLSSPLLVPLPSGLPGWRLYRKPVPPEIDEWTHYLHDPSNDAVARDSVVAPPKHLQWVGSPSWTRHHDHMSSFNAMVSTNGRVFYVIDLGIRAGVQLPAEWALVARDAFNGVVLWQRGIEHWQTQLWPLKSGPALLPRRLVAVGDTVFVTLGLGEPVTALDAATGEAIRTYEGTAGTEEILCLDGTLYLVAEEKPTARPWSTKATYANIADVQSEPNTWAWSDAPRRVMAVDAATGKDLWEKMTPVVPMTLTVDDSHVYFHDGQHIVALARSGGGEAWVSKPVARAPRIRSWFAPTLVAQDGVLVFAGGEKVVRHRGGTDTMTALSAENGKVLWTAPHPPSGYDSPQDVFIIDGLVWTAPLTNKRDSGLFTGRDLRTGEVRRTFAADDGVHMPHHRCHRAKATERFIVTSRTGIEYVDLKQEHWDRNDWVRGACLYGVVPANGLTYAPPHSCACYILAKLNGLNALAGTRTSRVKPNTPPPRLNQGPAYDSPIRQSAIDIRQSGDWPTYRGNAARSGSTTGTSAPPIPSIPCRCLTAWPPRRGACSWRT